MCLPVGGGGLLLDVVVRCAAHGITRPLIIDGEDVYCPVAMGQGVDGLQRCTEPGRSLAGLPLKDHPSSRSRAKHGHFVAKVSAIDSSGPRPGHCALSASRCSIMRWSGAQRRSLIASGSCGPWRASTAIRISSDARANIAAIIIRFDGGRFI